MLYLLPTVSNSKKTLILEYKVIEKKEDKRTLFYKDNQKCIITESQILNILRFVSNTNVKVIGERVLLPDGETAHRFFKYIFGESAKERDYIIRSNCK